MDMSQTFMDQVPGSHFPVFIERHERFFFFSSTTKLYNVICLGIHNPDTHAAFEKVPAVIRCSLTLLQLRFRMNLTKGQFKT